MNPHTYTVYTCKGFKGHWPVGTAAVVAALDEDHAKRQLAEALTDEGLPTMPDDLEVRRFDVGWPGVRILCDGQY